MKINYQKTRKIQFNINSVSAPFFLYFTIFAFPFRFRFVSVRSGTVPLPFWSHSVQFFEFHEKFHLLVISRNLVIQTDLDFSVKSKFHSEFQIFNIGYFIKSLYGS